MRVLITVPHYYRGISENARHGSESSSAKTARKQALETMIFNLHSLFGRRHFAAVHWRKAVTSVFNPLAMDLDIVVCTTGGDHLLGELEIPATLYTHVETRAEPRYLGWECHQLLEEALGKYDYYCYMEDDLLIEDPFFFAKLKLVNRAFAEAGEPLGLLQPQRYETSLGGVPVRQLFVHRIYMDYQAGEKPRFVADPLHIEYLGVSFTLEPTSHPHSGCFFLTAEQMRHLSQQPIFLDRAKIWVSPLDTAATLAISKTFRVYKPALDSMQFLEVRHLHPAMIQQLYPHASGIPSWQF